MKLKNKYGVAFNEDGVIVAKCGGNVEIFVPENIQVETFDSEKERDAYIIAEGLVEKLYD